MDSGRGRSDTGHGLRLLSLDGGGIKGLSELIIVEELMERVRKRERLQKTPIPADYFDLIGGTSTGGLIAILLGRLKMSTAEAIEAYENLAQKVFSKKKMKWKDGTFKAKLLEKAIIETIDDVLGEGAGRRARMWDETDPDLKRAFVCAVVAADVTHGAGPARFRTYDVAKNNEHNCLIWEAARATSAAPTIFKRILIGPKASAVAYVDAALGFNNPVKQVVEEACEIFSRISIVHCIVSVGTGTAKNTAYSTPNLVQRWLPTKLIDVLKKMATNSHQVAEEMEKRYENISDIYHRFNVDRGLSDVSLEEWKRLGDVRAYTKNYVKLTDVNRRLDSVVSSLIGLPEHRGCELGNLAISTPSATYMTYNNIPSTLVSHFVRREALLSEIETWSSDKQRLHRKIVLFGMGGCGKTQLALAYCEKLAMDGSHTAILWIDAGSPVSVMQGYVSIARMISGAWGDGAMPSDQAMTFVKHTISSWKSRWLMVLDNYDNPSAFQDNPIYHYLPQGNTGTILFTSRHTSAQRLGHTIFATDMELKECLELLFLRPYSKREEKIGTEIVEVLGFLALAIDQAGAYIRDRDLDLEDFIPHYEAQKKRTLSDIPDTWEYWKRDPNAEKNNPLSVFTTWELSFRQLKGTDLELKQKASFLSVAAFVNNNGIAEEYLRALYMDTRPKWMLIFSKENQWDSDAFREILAEFRRLSLIQSFDRRESRMSFNLHPLVSEWAKLRLSSMDRKKYLLESVAAMTSLLRTTPLDSLSVSKKQELVLHLRACCRNDGEFLDTEVEGLGSLPESSSTFAQFYADQGLYADSILMHQRAIAALRKTHAPAHERLIEEMLRLACVYRRAGKYAETTTTCKEVLINGIDELGPRHRLVLATEYEVAEVYRHKGEYRDAENLHSRCFEGREAVIGPEHLDTLASAEALGETLRRLARYDSAELMQRRALDSYKRQLDPMDLRIFTCNHVLGAIMRDKGRYAEAEEMHRAALMGREKALGKDHPDTLNSVNNLALVLKDRKKCAESEDLHRRALDARRRVLGPDHQQTLTSRSNLAKAVHDQGKYHEALQLQSEALTGHEAVLGPTHPFTLDCVNHLGQINLSLRNLDTAKDLFIRDIKDREATSYPDHPDTLRSVKGLADVLNLQGDLDTALSLYERCYDGRCKAFTADHPSIRQCLQDMRSVQEKLKYQQ